jgi:predicted RNA polymerase sigma factor
MASRKERAHRLTHFTCWHPILPAFSARIVIALRTLLGIAVSKYNENLSHR